MDQGTRAAARPGPLPSTNRVDGLGNCACCDRCLNQRWPRIGAGDSRRGRSGRSSRRTLGRLSWLAEPRLAARGTSRLRGLVLVEFQSSPVRRRSGRVQASDAEVERPARSCCFESSPGTPKAGRHRVQGPSRRRRRVRFRSPPGPKAGRHLSPAQSQPRAALRVSIPARLRRPGATLLSFGAHSDHVPVSMHPPGPKASGTTLCRPF